MTMYLNTSRTLENWYNRYLTAKGIKVYSPRSVVKALQKEIKNIITQGNAQ